MKTYPNLKRCFVALCLILVVGCTVTVAPLPKKPVPNKKKTVSHHVHHPPPSPTPTATARPHRPMQLEPTDKPTPMINIEKVTRLNLSTDPMI
jgi:hypothetical protein